MLTRGPWTVLLIALLIDWGCEGHAADGDPVLRVGYFPNLTHAQALVAQSMAREGRPWFEPRLGERVRLEWFSYNSGATAMEAILAKTIDMTYAGVTPPLNAFIRMKGRDIRIVAGACLGGAALVVHQDGPIRTDADFKGKQIGTPQLGNTQDVAARSWLQSRGFQIRLTGGDALVIPTANPDLYTLFRKGELDAVWTVEPWVSRLVQEANGRIYLEESSLWKEQGGRYATTLLVSGTRFTEGQPERLKRFLAAHVELSDWIQAHPDEAKALVNSQLKEQTRRSLAQRVLDDGWKRLEFTADPMRPSVRHAAESMKAAGLARTIPEMNALFHLQPLEAVLAETKRPALTP